MNFKKGDWIAELETRHPRIGTVREAFELDDVEILSVEFYALDGSKIGRISSPKRGPTTYEPGIVADCFCRIATPKFPIVPDRCGYYDHLLIWKKPHSKFKKPRTSLASLAALRGLNTTQQRAKDHARIHATLTQHGPMTSGEYYGIYVQAKSGSPLTQTRARFTELYYMGGLDKVGMRDCQVTGHTATVWQAVPKPWTPREKPITVREAIVYLEEAEIEADQLFERVEELQLALAQVQAELRRRAQRVRA